MTNATKAVVASFLSAGINLAVLFGFDLSGDQVVGLNVFIDSGLLMVVALTYKDSPKRVPEGNALVINGEVVKET